MWCKPKRQDFVFRDCGVDEDGYYIVSCPPFKGCHSYGETMEEAMNNIREAIELCLEEEGIEGMDKAIRFIGYREVEIDVKNAKAPTDQGK